MCKPKHGSRDVRSGNLNIVGVRIRGPLGDIDPLNKLPYKGAISRVEKGPPLTGPLKTT